MLTSHKLAISFGIVMGLLVLVHNKPEPTVAMPKLEHPADIIEKRVYKYIRILNPSLPDDVVDFYATEIAIISYTTGIDDALLVAVIDTESSFNPDAKSKKKAIGSMQIVPKYWKDIPYDIYDHVGNIQAGTYILNEYKEQCGSWKCSVIAYNIGITNYNRNRKMKKGLRYQSKIQHKMTILNSKFEWKS